ncbi:tetratricopeptide repeat protein [Streptomyces qinglanensis]|uniref:tetratricopeptide repeat protein n=1 Tax=Streptomyces qinglanensis TaxID=943816 RepID=UPI00379EFCB7
MPSASAGLPASVGAHAARRSLAVGYAAPGSRITYVTSSARGVGLPHQIGVVPQQAGCFQPRAVLRRLADALEAPGGGIPCQVLSGLGGVGKTQIAARYARETWRAGHVQLLVWATAATREAVLSTYAQAATEVLGSDASDPERAARAFLAWLEPGATGSAVRWLVVLDDLADPADLRGLWPPAAPHGRTLVTTRRRDAALSGSGRRLETVDLFSPAEATDYLRSALALHDRVEPPEQLAALATDLGLLPLALSQAATHLVDTDLDCATYRALLLDRGRTMARLLPEQTALPDDQPNSVVAAWLLSVDRADELRPVGLARPMLQLLSVLDPHGIPMVVLTSGPAIGHLAAHGPAGRLDAQDAVQALRALHRLSLIGHAPAQPHRAVQVHQLVQRTTREALDTKRRRHVVRAAADALGAAWPEIERDTDLARSLRANAAALFRYVDDGLYEAGMHPLLLRLGRSLGKSGQVGGAVAYHRELVEAAAARLGALHPDTLTVRHDMAQWMARAGEPVEAAGVLADLVRDRQRVLGPDHPDTLLTRGSLTQRIGERGDPAGAVAGFAALRSDMIRVLGPDHPYTLNSEHIEACWRGEAGDAPSAVDLLVAVLERLTRVLGPDHPRTLTARSDLARWRMEARRPAEAVRDLTGLLADRERVLGRDHPDTLVTRRHLAVVRGLAGDSARAVAELERLLPDTERVLGPAHPHAHSVRYQLAESRGHSGDPDGAAADLRRLLAEATRALGPEHRRTLNTRRRLAEWQGRAGDFGTAVAELTELCAYTDRLLGPDHRRTHRARAALAEWQGRLAGPEQAVALLEAVLADAVRAHGTADPHTVGIRDRLARWRLGTPPLAESVLT